MNKDEFDTMIELKINELISLIVEQMQINLEEALLYLYETQLYEKLIDESTKLWHLSALKLYLILKEEKRINQLILPDYV